MATGSVISGKTALLSTLQTELEKVDDGDAEHLAANLLSKLLAGVGVYVAKTGSQFGGDAGTVGLRRRHIRVESKRYKQSTYLSPRMLAGEIVEASHVDPHLEVWILVATKAVSETERGLARDEADRRGFPMIVIDWTAPAAGAGINPLAALCAQWPDVVETHVNRVAADAARALTAHVGSAVDDLRANLEMWNIGFESLRKKTAAHLQRLWVDSAQSKATLNQDAAGGRAGIHLIERKDVLRELSNWWLAPSDIRSPVAVTGLEGVGKTWAALDWVNQSLTMLPIVLPFPASAFVSNQDFSDTGVRDLIASSLRRITNSHQSREYWRLRVDRLLERPVEDGATFLLLLDGLNQQPFVRWPALAQALQGDTLVGKVRLLCTARRHYFEEDMRQFRELVIRPAQVRVGTYSPSELEELLRLHSVSSSDLPHGLLDLASTPRLFPLVMRLKDKDAIRSDASVLRLLFEYGKDVHQVRQQGALTDSDWVQWLASRANEYRKLLLEKKASQFSTTITDITRSLDTASVSREEVARRLSDVVDDRLFEKEVSVTGIQRLVLNKEPAVLGLGIALLDTISGADTFEGVQTRVLEWLEPVAAIDIAADVLKAALAILSATGTPYASSITDVLLVLWMNLQNPSSNFERDAFSFGESFPRSMLTVIERASLSSQSSAFHYATQSLRRLPRSRTSDWESIRSRMMVWTSWVTLPDKGKLDDPNHYAKHHHDYLLERVGIAEPSMRVVHGEELKLDYSHPGDPAVAIAGILEGHDLSAFMPVIRRAAVRQAVRVDHNDRSWEGLRWVLLVACPNASKARDEVAQMAEALLISTPEQGVHPRLRNRAAAYLLRLTGEQNYEERAAEINETFGQAWNYQSDYLDKPGRSFFELEFRHIGTVLSDTELSTGQKLDRLSRFLALPTFQLPEELLQPIIEEMQRQTFSGVNAFGHSTVEEHNLERLVRLGGRFAPAQLADMARRWLSALADRKDDQKYWAALAAPEHILVADEERTSKFALFRTASSAGERNQLANTWSLQLELLHKNLGEQLQLLLEADDYHFLDDLVDMVRPADASQLRSFLQEAGAEARDKAAYIVMSVMAHHCTESADELAEDLLPYLGSEKQEVRGIAFVALGLCAPQLTGRELLAMNWKADAADPWTAHYGSKALVAASKHHNLADVLPLIAPWLWLEAAVSRGSIAAELEFVTQRLVAVIGSPASSVAEAEGVLSVRMPKPSEMAHVLVKEPDDTKGDLGETLKRAARNPEEVSKRMQRLAQDAAATIERMRRQGHSLYLHTFEFEAVEAAYKAAPAAWEPLLKGVDSQSKEFQQRVRLAEGLYLCLCDVLLVHAPIEGLRLWRALFQSMRVRFNGPANIQELVHIAFRAPDSKEVLAARADLVTIQYCNTDQDVFEMVIATQIHGRQAWLDALIAEDEASDLLWRRKRAIVFKGFNTLPAVDKLEWPEGTPAGSAEALKRSMLKWTSNGALAKYWWDRFIGATDADSAYAAWHVFLGLADRRAWVWRRAQPRPTTDLDRLRKVHLGSNKDLYGRTLKKPEEGTAKLGEKFLGLDKPAKWLMLDGALSR
ncbi:MAG: hypothetical protein RL489_1753 [Pseudomonadota bacterium]|jgi:hypothetical protein